MLRRSEALSSARQSLGGGPDLSDSFSSPPPPESPNGLSVQPFTNEQVNIASSGKSRGVSLLDMVGGKGTLRRTNVCNIRKEVQTLGFGGSLLFLKLKMYLRYHKGSKFEQAPSDWMG